MVDTVAQAFWLKVACAVLALVFTAVGVYFDVLQDRLARRDSDKALVEARERELSVESSNRALETRLAETGSKLAAAEQKLHETSVLATQINERTSPRHLSSEKAKALREAVGRFPDRTLVIKAFTSDGESMGFAKEIGEAVRGAIRVEFNSGMSNNVPKGLVLTLPPSDADPLAIALVSLLGDFQVSTTPVPTFCTGAANPTFLVVGLKP